MNIWTIISLALSLIFGIISIIFALLKEKGAILVSGFNSFSKEEQKKYDKKQISIDMRNSLFLWFLILLIGAALSYLSSKYFAIISLIIWIILFFRDVYLDSEKAFKKYKI